MEKPQPMTSRIFAGAVAAFVILATSAAGAQPNPGRLRPNQAMRQACATDAKTFCGDITPGGGRLMQCMRAHADKLSAGCQDAVAQARAAHRAAHPAGQGEQPAPPR